MSNPSNKTVNHQSLWEREKKRKKQQQQYWVTSAVNQFMDLKEEAKNYGEGYKSCEWK